MKKKFEKQILRYGKWNHPKAPNGVLEINEDYGKRLIENYTKTPFSPVVRGHISNHEAEKNPSLVVSKNITNLSLKDNGIYAEFEMDEKELDTYNDVSASINPDYTDNETGSKIGPVLEHVALVMNPYIKRLDTFVALSNEVEDNKYIILLSEISMAEEKKVTEEVAEETKAQVEVTEPVKTEEVAETKVEVEEVKAEVKEEEKKEEVAEEKKDEEVSLSSDDIRKELEETKIKLAEAEAKQRTADAELYFSDLLNKGKALPTFKAEIVQLASISSDSIQLGESQESVKDVLTKLFDKLPVLVNLHEKGIDIETGRVDLSESAMTAIRAVFEKTNPKGTEEEFEIFQKDYADKYKDIK